MTPMNIIMSLLNEFDISCDVIDGTSIEIFGIVAIYGGCEALEPVSHCPPVAVELHIRCGSIEDRPTPLIHRVRVRNESNLQSQCTVN